MKVWVLATSFPRFFHGDGACGNFVYQLNQALAKHLEVKVIAPHAPGARTKEVLGQVEVHRFVYFWPKKSQRIAYGEKGIIENLKSSFLTWIQLPPFLGMLLWKGWKLSKDCDLIHAHWIITAFLALFIKKLRHIPVVLTGSIFTGRMIEQRHCLLTLSSTIKWNIPDPTPGAHLG